MQLGALLEPVSPALKARFNAEIEASYRILALSLASRPGGDPELAAMLAGLAERRPGDRLGGGVPEPAQAEDGLTRAVRDFVQGAAPSGERPEVPFLARDVKTNPDYIRFALKTSAAAMICYLFYTGLSWPGIHTAFITCFFVALGTAGETLHKMTLRIVGCIVGGAAALATAVWLMPHLQDVGQLALLIGAFSFVAAWVAGGGPRIYYAGGRWRCAFSSACCKARGQAPIS